MEKGRVLLTDSQLSDYRWFVGEMPSLYREYGDSYLAIKDKVVIGAYPSFGEAVDGAARELGDDPFIVQRCGVDESAYTANVASAWVTA